MTLKNRIFLILILLAIAGCAVLIWQFIETNAPDKSVQNGVLNLSQWDKKTTLFLSGEWDFYWEKFLNHDDFCHNPAPDLKAEVPSVWNKFSVDGKQLGGMGYATYRLHVTGAKVGLPLAMRIIPFSTAYELYIDDTLTASSGKVSTSADGFFPQYRIQTVAFTPEKDEFDVILHISNFIYARGGAWYTIYFGNQEEVYNISQVIFARDFFVLSCLLLISAYGIFLLFLRRDMSYLLFFSMCVFFALRTIIDGSYLINFFMPSIWLRAVVCIDYITLYWLPGLCMWLFQYIYSENMSRMALKALMIYAFVFTVITLVVPIYIFTNFIYIAELIVVVTCIYGVSKMLMFTLKRKLEAFYIVAGGSVQTICVFHDVLSENNLMKTGYVEWSPMGFLCLAILILCMFMVRYDRNNRESRKMLLELNEADKRERKLELQFLKSQIRPHFVNNALNAIISISRTDTEKSRKLLVEFSKYLRNCYRIQNLEDKEPIENELSSVRAYIALEQARFSDSLHVVYDIDNMFLRIPPLTLQPLVENAVIHGIKGKSGDRHILIYVKDCGDFVKVGVSDDGGGIDAELAAALLSGEYKGDSIGIGNINRRMKRLYGTNLHIENRPEGGTNAYIMIPKE